LLAEYYHLQNPLFAVTFLWGLSGLGLLIAYTWGKIPRRSAEWLLVGLTACDLVIFAQVNVASTPPEKVYPATPAIQFLQEKMADDLFRIGAAPNTLYQGASANPNYQEYRADHSWF